MSSRRSIPWRKDLDEQQVAEQLLKQAEEQGVDPVGPNALANGLSDTPGQNKNRTTQNGIGRSIEPTMHAGTGR